MGEISYFVVFVKFYLSTSIFEVSQKCLSLHLKPGIYLNCKSELMDDD